MFLLVLYWTLGPSFWFCSEQTAPAFQDSKDIVDAQSDSILNERLKDFSLNRHEFDPTVALNRLANLERDLPLSAFSLQDLDRLYQEVHFQARFFNAGKMLKSDTTAIDEKNIGLFKKSAVEFIAKILTEIISKPPSPTRDYLIQSIKLDLLEYVHGTGRRIEAEWLSNLDTQGRSIQNYDETNSKIPTQADVALAHQRGGYPISVSEPKRVEVPQSMVAKLEVHRRQPERPILLETPDEFTYYESHPDKFYDLSLYVKWKSREKPESPMFFFYRNAEYRPNFPAELSALNALIALRKVRDFSKEEVSLLTTYAKNILTTSESDRKLLKEARRGL